MTDSVSTGMATHSRDCDRAALEYGLRKRAWNVTLEDNFGLGTSSQRDQFREKLPIGRVAEPVDVAALAYDADGGKQFVTA